MPRPFFLIRQCIACKALIPVLLLLWLVLPAPAAAMSVIRDAEVEAALSALAEPVLRVAGLEPEAVRLVILNDRGVNAFVAGGANIFINAGVFLQAEDAATVIGVLAHESGHIAAGHLMKGAEALKDAQFGTILSTIIGAVAILTSSGDVGAAVISAGQQAALGNLLSYSRENEQAADYSAVQYMKKLQIPVTGLMDLFSYLRKQESLGVGDGGYARTHPLTKERMTLFRSYVQDAAMENARTPAVLEVKFIRARAKLAGFLLPVEEVMQRFPGESLPERYARSIAWFRKADIDKALELLRPLLEVEPQNPYFHELLGQMLFEFGRIKSAVIAYRQAWQLAENEPLIQLGLASALLATGKEESLAEAVTLLEQSVAGDRYNPWAWHWLAIAYGRAGSIGASYLALAEEAALTQKPKEARRYLGIALEHAEAGSPLYLRAQDLQRFIAEQLKAKNK